MKAIRIISDILAAASAAAMMCCVSSCDKNAHSGEDGIYLLPGFANTDHATKLNDITVFVFGQQGEKVKVLGFDSADEMMSTPVDLAPGDYCFIATANLRDDFVLGFGESSSGTGDDEVRKDRPAINPVSKAVNLEGIEEVLTDPEQLYIMFDFERSYSGNFCPAGRSFYAARDYTVKGEGVEFVQLPFASFLSEIELTVTGLTKPVEYTLRSYTASMGFYPGKKNTDGSYGVPMESSSGADMGFTQVISPDAPTVVFYNFQDIADVYYDGVVSNFRFDYEIITDSKSGCDFFSADNRLMLPGHRYQLNSTVEIPYDWLYMVTDVVPVNDWTERWNTNKTYRPQ